MTSWRGSIDIIDGEDVHDVKNSVEASVEYICQPDAIVIIWRFRPTKVNVVTENIYIALWTAYTPRIDGTICDTSPYGNQWPSATPDQQLYSRSSEALRDNWLFQVVPAGGLAKLLVQEPPCNRRNNGTYPDYHNNSISTFPEYRVHAGTWLEISEMPNAGPGLRLTVLDEPLTGHGTADDPQSVVWKDIGYAHENVDGTIVFGPGTIHDLSHFQAGRWYQSIIALTPK